MVYQPPYPSTYVKTQKHSKLTLDDALFVHANTHMTSRQLTEKLHCSDSTIYKIRTGRLYPEAHPCHILYEKIRAEIRAAHPFMASDGVESMLNTVLQAGKTGYY